MPSFISHPGTLASQGPVGKRKVDTKERHRPPDTISNTNFGQPPTWRSVCCSKFRGSSLDCCGHTNIHVGGVWLLGCVFASALLEITLLSFGPTWWQVERTLSTTQAQAGQIYQTTGISSRVARGLFLSHLSYIKWHFHDMLDPKYVRPLRRVLY
jgi:hypothetical protein